MKKREFYNHMDRNQTAVNGNYQKPHRTNIVSPEFLLGQLWIQEQESNGVKIVELDSNSSNNDVHEDEDKQTFSHAWSYINQDRFRIPQSPRHDNQVNYKAREKHRQNKTRYKQEISHEDEENAESCVRDFYYSNYQNPENTDTPNENYESHQKTNCFTNMNLYPKTSDSSTDVEYIDRDDLKAELAWNAAKDNYYDEILTYDSNIDADKRTIYIYSFKNKHLFTENDGTNISNGSSTSTEVGEEQINDKSNGRVASPIPDLYVPKLNFLKPPKLPTVTEITEPKSSEENLKTKYDTQMPIKWFQNKDQDTEFESGSTNLINWMSLSPREKRRRSTYCENCRHQAKLQVVRETSPIVEEDAQSMKNIVESNSPFLGDTTKIDYINPETDNKIQFFNDCEEKRVEDRGDHLHNKSFQKIKIQINPKTSGEPIRITEPIEKLDSNNWIGDESIVARDKNPHQYMDAIETVTTGEGDVSRRLWDNNMVLLKPSEWSEFYPVNSVPSLHLSLETEIEEVPWFKRIIRCLKCFK